MIEEGKPEERLVQEVAVLRQKITELEASDAERRQAQEERERRLMYTDNGSLQVEKLVQPLAWETDIFQVIMDNTGAMLAYLDPEFNFIKVNSSYARGSGHTVEELIGKNHFALFPNKENQTIFEQVRDSGERVEFHDKLFEFADQTWRGVTYWDWTLTPVKDISGSLQGLVLSLTETTDRKQAEEALKKLTHDLGERVKELNCLYAISDLAGRRDVSLEELLQTTANLIPPSWQYPEITCARIILNCQEFRTGDFRETVWKQTNDIIVRGAPVGSIEVYYLEEKPESDEGPFLKEERSLINVIAERLGEIIERKRVEEATVLAHAELDQVFHTTGHGMRVIDKDSNILRINDTFSTLTGVGKDDAVGKKCYTVFPGPTCHTSNCPLTKILSGDERVEYEVEKERMDGIRIPCILTATPLRGIGGEVIGIVEDFKDITERSRAEEALRESEKKYHSLFSEAQDGIVLIDRESGVIVDCNSEFEKQTGRQLEELKELKIWELRPHDMMETARKKFFEISEKGGGGSAELEFANPHGGIIPVEFVSRELNIGGRQFLQSIVRDITERRNMERELQDLLERERKLRQKLETEIESRIEFTRALVHELKTPLTPVLASSDLLVAELQEEPLLSLARNINQGASNLNRRIDELLDLARGEIGTLHLKSSLLDLRQLLEGAFGYMTTVASSRGQVLDLDLPPFLPHVWADADRLQQVVLNLLGNACKFTSDGTRITLRAREKDASLIVEVEDTGDGIAEEERQRLFEPYHRVEADRERLSGLGLGLALCKTLVELHGGQIWVGSVKDKGSTFTFSLPLEATSQSQEDTDGGPKP